MYSSFLPLPIYRSVLDRGRNDYCLAENRLLDYRYQTLLANSYADKLQILNRSERLALQSDSLLRRSREDSMRMQLKLSQLEREVSQLRSQRHTQIKTGATSRVDQRHNQINTGATSRPTQYIELAKRPTTSYQIKVEPASNTRVSTRGTSVNLKTSSALLDSGYYFGSVLGEQVQPPVYSYTPALPLCQTILLPVANYSQPTVVQPNPIVQPIQTASIIQPQTRVESRVHRVMSLNDSPAKLKDSTSTMAFSIVQPLKKIHQVKRLGQAQGQVQAQVQGQIPCCPQYSACQCLPCCPQIGNVPSYSQQDRLLNPK